MHSLYYLLFSEPELISLLRFLRAYLPILPPTNAVSFFCSPNIDFAGYTLPHPSQPKMELRIQTSGSSWLLSPFSLLLIFSITDGAASSVFQSSLGQLHLIGDHILQTFTDSMDNFERRSN